MTPGGPSLDADRVLALSYVPAARRPAIAALWRLDAAFGAVLAAGRDPLISRIKLAWWRDALDRLDRERAPAEPLLQGVATEVLAGGVSGAELAQMEQGWQILLSPDPLTAGDLKVYAANRGGLLFRFSARLLGETGVGAVERGGEAWALIDFARRSANAQDAEAAVALARRTAGLRGWPSRLRPLGMLAMLARRDAEGSPLRWESQGAPGRMVRMLRHRFTGN